MRLRSLAAGVIRAQVVVEVEVVLLDLLPSALIRRALVEDQRVMDHWLEL
jgi:hypothetical protein